jgi:secondary thiamine-phosphate synthase enzyme
MFPRPTLGVLAPWLSRRATIHIVWIQKQVSLRARPRGFHIVTSEITDAVPELADVAVGIATVFMQHTSASLALNENASPDVRRDFATWFDDAVPDGWPEFAHTLEGPDDMPAHIKSSLLGASLTIPVSRGRLALGTWQGIYLCEHRDHGGPRSVIVTAFGEAAD